MSRLYCRIATILFGLALVIGMFVPAKAQTTNAAPSQVEINGQVSFGLGYGTSTNLLNYVEPGTTTALFNGVTTIWVPPSTTNQVLNLATLFPYINTPILWGMQDVSSPGQECDWGFAASGGRFNMAPGGFTINRVVSGSPTLYLDNPSSTTSCILKVFVLAN